MENKEIEREKEIKRRKRTYKSSNPTKVIKDGWCHQCKIKQPEVLACVNFWKKKSKKRNGGKKNGESVMDKEGENEYENENESENNKCNGKYCAKCIQKHYQQDFNELKEISEWKCFSCDLTCKCAVCRRKRGNYLMQKKKRMEEEKKKCPLKEGRINKRIKMRDFNREGEELIQFDEDCSFYPSFLGNEAEDEKTNISPYNFIHYCDSIPFIPPNSKFQSSSHQDTVIHQKFTFDHKEENFIFSSESSMSDDSNDNLFQESNLIKIEEIKMINEVEKQINPFSFENSNDDFSILHQSNDYLLLDDNFHLLFNQC